VLEERGDLGQGETYGYTIEKRDVVALGADCTVRWQHSLEEELPKTYSFAEYHPTAYALATDDKMVYVGGPEGQIVALSYSDGSPVWQVGMIPGSGNIRNLLPGKDGALYALGDRAVLLALDAQGQLVWSQPIVDPGLPSQPGITSSGDMIMVHNGRVLAYTYDAQWVRQEPTPVPPPDDKTVAEQEIETFIVDFIVRQEIGGTADYIQTSGQPWVDAPPKANLIVFAPVSGDQGSLGPSLNSEAALHVWWYAEGQLTEADDQSEAMAQYREQYMENPGSNIWAYGYYEFGIMSISDDFQHAEVYLGASCGPLCGHGFKYQLQRSPSGKWWITDGQQLWQS
jgi:hypothetical protein